MAKGTRAQPRQSSAIHLIQEDAAPTILNPDVAPGREHLPSRWFPEMSGMAMHHLKKASRTSTSDERTILSMVNPATVLKELFELLEDYAPVWYTEENHNRAVAALAQTMR